MIEKKKLAYGVTAASVMAAFTVTAGAPFLYGAFEAAGNEGGQTAVILTSCLLILCGIVGTICAWEGTE
jgi:hypothetical protein